MATELKPCPFCGYSAVLEIILVRKGYEGDVKCNRCLGNMHTITLDSPDEAEREAIEAWNRRSEKTPCDLCRYNPPSSMDGKPCTMCVAEGRG